MKAALESIVFNYGSLDDKTKALVMEGIKTGNYNKLADDIENRLGRHDRGINQWRRTDEANLIRGGTSKRAGVGFRRTVVPPSEVPSSTKRMSGGIVEHLHGDPGRSGYDYGGHGRESNAHDHFAFASKDLRLAVQRDLAAGKGPSGRKWQIGSTTGGKHAPNSYHYVGQAFDVPWSQFGSGAIGQSDYEQSRQLKADVDALVRKYTQQKPTPKKPPSEVSSSVSATPSYQKVAVAAPVEQPPSTPIVIGGGGQQMVASGPSRRDLTNRSSQVRFNSRLWSA